MYVCGCECVCACVADTEPGTYLRTPCTAADVRPVADQHLEAVEPGTSLDYLFHTIPSTPFFAEKGVLIYNSPTLACRNLEGPTCFI